MLKLALLGLSAFCVAVRAQDATTPTNTPEDPWLESGCSMAPDTALMQCLGDYASVPPAAPTGLQAESQAAYYCSIYQQLADCWAAGLYCKEWYPMQVAANKLCSLANVTEAQPTSTTSVPPTASAASSVSVDADLAVEGTASNKEIITVTVTINTVDAATATQISNGERLSTLSSVVAEASNVITSIWNNDSGTDIPVISNDLASETIATWTHMSDATPAKATAPPITTLTTSVQEAATPTLLVRKRKRQADN